MRRGRYSPRCPDGFIRGLCREPSCWAFDGHHTEPKYTPIPCQSCGGSMFGGMGGKFNVLSERVCAQCLAGVREDRKRRESQEAYLGHVPKAWWA